MRCPSILKTALSWNGYFHRFGKMKAFKIILRSFILRNKFSMNTYGLIGKNIDYSFSKNYFNNKFKKEGIENAQYINFDIDNIGELNNIFKRSEEHTSELQSRP